MLIRERNSVWHEDEIRSFTFPIFSKNDSQLSFGMSWDKSIFWQKISRHTCAKSLTIAIFCSIYSLSRYRCEKWSNKLILTDSFLGCSSENTVQLNCVHKRDITVNEICLAHCFKTLLLFQKFNFVLSFEFSRQKSICCKISFDNKYHF